MISCLTLTHNRFELLKEAIECYKNQTHSDKELVIVCDGDKKYFQNLEWLAADDIRIIPCEHGKTIGELRNIAVAAACGEVTCQWDDDELNDPLRLSKQLALKGSAPAHCLSEQLRYLEKEKKLYHLKANGPIAGSLMADRDLLISNPYPCLPKGEDSALVQILHQLKVLAVTANDPWLHIYRYHGDNTWNLQHQHLRIASLSCKISPDVLQSVQQHWPKISEHLSDPPNMPIHIDEKLVAAEIAAQIIYGLNNVIHQSQKAIAFGVPEDSKTGRGAISGRTIRDALGEENVEIIQKLASVLAG